MENPIIGLIKEAVPEYLKEYRAEDIPQLRTSMCSYTTHRICAIQFTHFFSERYISNQKKVIFNKRRRESNRPSWCAIVDPGWGNHWECLQDFCSLTKKEREQIMDQPSWAMIDSKWKSIAPKPLSTFWWNSEVTRSIIFVMLMLGIPTRQNKRQYVLPLVEKFIEAREKDKIIFTSEELYYLWRYSCDLQNNFSETIEELGIECILS